MLLLIFVKLKKGWSTVSRSMQNSSLPRVDKRLDTSLYLSGFVNNMAINVGKRSISFSMNMALGLKGKTLNFGVKSYPVFSSLTTYSDIADYALE